MAEDIEGRFGRALQSAALNYASGVYGLIRNPATHDTGEWDEQEALEKLAASSVLARTIEGAEVQVCTLLESA